MTWFEELLITFQQFFISQSVSVHYEFYITILLIMLISILWFKKGGKK